VEFDPKKLLNKKISRPVVAIQGLGFVGAAMSVVCANAIDGEYTVIGVDRDNPASRERIEAFNRGEFPLNADDPKIYEYYRRGREKGNLWATWDPTVYQFAEIIIVDVNLDVEKSSDSEYNLTGYDVDLRGFTDAIRTIGRNCKPDALILVETTVPPGTCKNVVKPSIEQELLMRELPTDQIRIGHSYERVMPGPNYVDSIQSFYRVYSGVDENSADATEAFLKTIIRTDEYPLTRLEHTNATEMAKVLENAYRAMNIAFVVEWSRLAEEARVDLYEIVRAIRLRPTHANLMFPGIGVGGYCLTKDPLLASWSRSNLIGGDGNLPQSETAVSINDQMPRYAFEFLLKRYGENLAAANVVLLGVSYRGDVGDTRFSPVQPFYELLVKTGASVRTHDPFVEIWDETGCRPEQGLTEVFKGKTDIAVVSAGHTVYKKDETVDKLMEQQPMWVYDTIGLFSAAQIERLRERHTVIVLGRGDL
jgi:UDP-N-acetyl-D-glucosamine dehydrogenase